MKNNIKNKILVILLILILFLSISSNVFALSQTEVEIFEFDQLYYDSLYELDEYSSGNYWYTIRPDGDHCSVLFISKEDYPDLKTYISNSQDQYGNFRIYFNTDNSSVTGIYYTYYSSSGTFVNRNISNHGYFDIGVKNNGIYIGTNIDIYTDNSYTTLFFQQPPVTLEEIMRQEGKQLVTMREILAVLPMILSVLVSLIALRKALSMLLRLLRQS